MERRMVHAGDHPEGTRGTTLTLNIRANICILQEYKTTLTSLRVASLYYFALQAIEHV